MDIVSVLITLILGAVGGFFSSYLMERGKNFATKQDIAQITETQAKVQNKYDALLEQLRGEIDRTHTILSTAMSNFAQGHQVAQERRLTAIGVMWNAIIELESMASTPIFFYSILLPSEYNTASNKPSIRPMLAELDDTKIANTIADHSKQVDLQRPFLGETLWSLYVGYQAFLGRVTLKLAEGWQQKNITAWVDDAGTLQLLQSLLTEDEISSVKAMRLPILRHVLNYIDSKIMKEVNRLISGQVASDESVAQAMRILEAVQEANRNSKTID